MSRTIRFFVPGKPVPFARARKQGKRHFDDPKYKAAKQHIAAIARAVWRDSPREGACVVRIAAFVGPPAAKTKDPVNVIKKPDVDNYIKTVLDACNNVIWLDDCQVVRVTCTKRYSEVPHTVVTVRWIGCSSST